MELGRDCPCEYGWDRTLEGKDASCAGSFTCSDQALECVRTSTCRPGRTGGSLLVHHVARRCLSVHCAPFLVPVVKCPGALVVTLYAACEDIRRTVTPDLKRDDSVLLHVDVGAGRRRLGGTALAQCFKQIGNEPPDVEQPELLASAFATTQSLLRQDKLLAGHDISDGGLIAAALEMAFAGDRSLELDVSAPAHANDTAHGALAALFAEEVGLVLEVSGADEAAVLTAYKNAGVPCSRIGHTAPRASPVYVKVNGTQVVEADLGALRDEWEATSFELEKLQAAPACVAQEQAGLASRHAPGWQLSFTPKLTASLPSETRPRVAVLRQEGSNGDREMAAALYTAGLQPWDVAMGDLQRGAISLDGFRGVIFVGGFSYADVLDSAKGWAGVVKFDERLSSQVKS